MDSEKGYSLRVVNVIIYLDCLCNISREGNGDPLQWKLLLGAVHGLRIAMASLAIGFEACGLQQLWRTGSVIIVHGLSCSVACGDLK